MAKRKAAIPDINQAIAAKLQGYPQTVSELAMRAVQLAGSLTADDVAEAMEALVREMARSEGPAEL
jgi:type II secretory pathway predicted ATPase ExeA